ncbi:MAG: hypothetical protein ACJASQ_002900 [Crocinitomicaceae bacterium]|jgi:hypothetical protein
MKKIFIISLTVIGLGFVSCQKENIAPNSSNNLELPAWENARAGGDEEGSEGGDENTIGAITDPNEDQDAPPITDPNDDQDKTKEGRGDVLPQDSQGRD